MRYLIIAMILLGSFMPLSRSLMKSLVKYTIKKSHPYLFQERFLTSRRRKSPLLFSSSAEPEIRNEDLNQMKDLDLILSERAKRFNLGPTAVAKEQCILLTVESRSQNLRSQANVSSENEYFSFEESLNELSELVGTAGTFNSSTLFHL